MTEEPEWYEELIGPQDVEKEEHKLEPFAVGRATEAQKEAIRNLASQVGFKDMRGFWAWTKSADLNYYDLIKVASPE